MNVKLLKYLPWNTYTSIHLQLYSIWDIICPIDTFTTFNQLSKKKHLFFIQSSSIPNKKQIHFENTALS